ncbi:MAG: right-handed parallel beta-helix repeat-containing protein [Candidatus Cyclobacteriaceae bacterium M2_1C_046]
MNNLRDYFFAVFILLVGISVFSCEPEVELKIEPEIGVLAFSQDTIFFDTLFTETRSVTKRLKIYNQASGAITIDKIAVKDAAAFSLYIYGEKGKSFNDVQLLGKDSLLVLVEAEIDNRGENTPFIIKDELQVISHDKYSIPLIAWGQDAVFLKDTVLSCDARFTNEKPYVVFGAVVVDSLCTLTVDPGARIFSHFNSGIFVWGSIKAQGTSDQRVLFSNDRWDEGYRNAPGQWRGIYLLEGSTGNEFQFTDIRNAELGIRVGAPDDNTDFDVVIGHTRIENIARAGVLAFTSDVYVYNSLINNCGEASIAALAGGNYKFYNNTLANFSFDFFREEATLILSNNLILSDNSVLTAPLHAELINNIIWGDLSDEIILSEVEDEVFEVNFLSNILKTTLNTFETQNYINIDPLFIAPQEYNYSLDSLSPAIDQGIVLPEIKTDLEGKMRDNNPDLGALEVIK